MWGTPHRSRTISTDADRPGIRSVPSICGRAACAAIRSASPSWLMPRHGRGGGVGPANQVEPGVRRASQSPSQPARPLEGDRMDHRPWYASYPPDVPKSLEPYPEKSVFSIVEDAARRFPERPAIAWFGRHLSYKQLMAEIERFSAVLAALGV